MNGDDTHHVIGDGFYRDLFEFYLLADHRIVSLTHFTL